MRYSLCTILVLLTLLEYGFLAAKREGLDWGIFFLQIFHESKWKHDVVSSAGAVGIAQIVPWAHPKVDPWNPYDSIDYAAALDRKYLNRYQNYAIALAAYHAGEGAIAKYNGVPDYPETEIYLQRILGPEWESRYSRTVPKPQPASRGGTRVYESLGDF